ncbi:MAG: DUF1819 family protein, partial [Verrucomicrobia bacterium]|nr:DUF1819 family protein [Verrucomicrobiota bacterium]
MTEDSSSATAAPLYTSRIIKASALIADTRLLLAEWEPARPVAENLDRLRRQNVFGKTSRSRIEDILVIFRQRYFDDPDVGAALVTLAQGDEASGWLDPLLYFFATQNDCVLRDVVVDLLYPRQQAGFSDAPVDVVERQIREWVAEGKTTSRWGDATMERVAQGMMATLRDFGVLQGKMHKRIAPVYLPAPAFALIAHWLHRREGSGDRTLRSDDWKLFFLPVAGVERLFIE